MISLKKLFKPVKAMDTEQAKSFMAQNEEGTFTILDVRQPKEYEAAHIPGAKLIPLPSLHDSLKELDPEKPVITYCAIGGRSRVAAQLLSGMGFREVYDLKGGIKAWNGLKALGPQELNLDMVSGDETPAEIIKLAYGMETGMQRFYKEMHQGTEDQELRGLFKQLADIEERHKKLLYELNAKTEPSTEDLERFEADADSIVLEGGFRMAEFMEANKRFLQTVHDVIYLAMMVETQALDLYLRFADKSTHVEAKEVLFKIADEEKAHLAALGRLLERKI